MVLNPDVAPVFVGEPIDFNGYRIVPEVLDLDGARRIRISDKNGNELLIPEDFLAPLTSRGNHAQSVLRSSVDAMRMAFHNPIDHYPNIIQANKRIVITETDAQQDGVPFIEWRTASTDQRNNQSTNHGWRLSLGGAHNSTIGFAEWNDIPGIANLVTMLSDPQGCITMGSMIDPAPIQQMCARMAARTLRSARSLPAVSLAKARKILSDASVPQGATSGAYACGMLRLLTIKSGDKDVPVAVAVAAPHEPVGTQQLTEEEARLPWQQRSALQEQYRSVTREPWIAAARAAFLTAGWRLLDLPKPQSAHYGSNSPYLWATPIDAQTWGSISAAAEREARDVSMSRGGKY